MLSRIQLAAKKTGGSTQNNRSSLPKYLGVKKYGMEFVQPGTAIVTQRGTKWHPGDNTFQGRRYTIHAKQAGFVIFKEEMLHHYKPIQDESPFETRVERKNHTVEATPYATEAGVKIRHRCKPRRYIHIINPFTHPECFDKMPDDANIDMKHWRPKPDAKMHLISQASQLPATIAPYYSYVPPKQVIRRQLPYRHDKPS